MNEWEAKYQRGEVFWDRGAASPPLVAWAKAHPELLKGRVLVIGCGHGHDVAALRELGVDAAGLDISPTALKGAAERYPDVPADHWLCEDLFNLSPTALNAWDVIIEHTCLSGMPPEMRHDYSRGVLAALKPAGLIVGIWFISPDLDPGHVGPPYPLPVEALDTLFAETCTVIEDRVPKEAYPGREGRERLRVLRKN
ncbi:MAG: methyltransferase [Verrucomicrobiaceae bacterium]|nr:methyltransferase [Verrucomicrobiaceae bacterium]